jgi:rubrerythrin
VLQSFAEDEDKHGQLLSSLAESYYLKQGRFDIPELKPTEYQDRQPGPIFCKRLEELASHPQPVAAAVDKFAQAESEAIELYQKLSRDSAEPEIAAFFAKLVDWERRHLDLLQKQAAAFNSQKP